MTTAVTSGRDAFRGECLSLAAQLELYAKIDGILPGVVAAMQESAAALRLAAKPADEGVREALVLALENARRDILSLRPRSDTGSKRARQIEASAEKIKNVLDATLSTTGEPK